MSVRIRVYSDEDVDRYDFCCIHVVQIIRSDGEEATLNCDGMPFGYPIIKAMLEFLGISIESVEYFSGHDEPEESNCIM